MKMNFRDRYVFGVLLLILGGCHTAPKNSTVESVEHKGVVLTSNDSVCYPERDRFHLKKIQFLTACYIHYSDSLSDVIAAQYGDGKLSRKYNFDLGSDYLEYSMNGDTVEVKKLYMVRSRDYVSFPDTIYQVKDTLFLKENGYKLQPFHMYHDFVFDEFSYRFLTKGTQHNLFFKLID